MEFRLKGNAKTGEYWINGKKITPRKSLKVRQISRGFTGTFGIEQLALAICLELFHPIRATKVYMSLAFNIGNMLWEQKEIDLTIKHLGGEAWDSKVLTR